MQNETTAQTSTHDTYHPELRHPLREALEIVAEIAESFDWELDNTPSVLEGILKDIQSQHQTCVDFEREFVSIALSIATGVGKTRLMGAIMTHLFLTGKSRNFFVLAPNLTIYEKLIQDFGNPAFLKYAFKGIAELTKTPPVVITGDNYAQASGLFAEKEMRINIFNISKFNKDSGESTGKKTGLPRIKRISEYLGQSYWKYLIGLNDLVILMDEAHRYHADKSKKVINELQPRFGIELTATPFVPKNGNAVADKETDKGNLFKNIVYEYSLAAALAEGKYIKEPAIATRENFSKEGKSEEEIERIKLEDAISVHEKTKLELQRYAGESNRKEVKPFILVVCKDTTHARDVYDYVTSKQFYSGAYAQKALQIDSTTRTTEEIEKQFVSLESLDNPIEIVIHVNMLKEGWDVSNLFTIVPLRAARALTLIEQTIGRGLRLPYGERVGDKYVDTLTIVSHEHFDQVIAASKEGSSIFKQMRFINIETGSEGDKMTLAVIPDRVSQHQQQKQEQIDTMQDVVGKQNAQTVLDAERAVINILPMVAESMPNIYGIQDMTKPEVRKVALEMIAKDLANRPGNLFSSQQNAEIIANAAKVYDEIVKDYAQNIIEIPRLSLQPEPPVAIFEDFDLDTTGQNGIETKFEFHIGNEQIIRESLVDNQRDFMGLLRGANERKLETPEQKIVARLLDFPEIEYDKLSTLLFKLARQATSSIKTTLRMDETLERVVFENMREIAKRIYKQMKKHFKLQQSGFQVSSIRPFSKIEKHNITIPMSAGRLDYKNDTFRKGDIGRLVFMGFKKSAHPEYKFHSKSELDFSRVLERDPSVEKWLRPASQQFSIYWGSESRKYEPDFVVETYEAIYLIEVKASNEVEDHDVKLKAKSAKVYCDAVSEYSKKYNKKVWHYLIIPHDQIQANSTFSFFVGIGV